MKTILAVSSSGGHWIQLRRLEPAFKDHKVIYLTTFNSNKKNLFKVTDASRWNKMLLIKQAFEVFKVVLNIKPDIIITTGASIGIWAVLTGSLIRCKRIWVDSIANSENISMSGKVVKPFTDVHITQWAKLESEKTIFVGTVL